MRLKYMLLFLLFFVYQKQQAACCSPTTNTPEVCANPCYAKSIFVPRQLSYNPILENGLTFNMAKQLDDFCFLFSVKPVYTQSVGCKLSRYFNIDHQSALSVQEDGSGDVDPLWFQVISSDSTYYSSTLSFCPIRRTYGAMLYALWQLPCDFLLSLNTAVAVAKNSMNMREKGVQNLGTAQFSTVGQSFMSSLRKYGKACDNIQKVGVDDIQLKLIKNVCRNDYRSWDLYALLGLPTGRGSHSKYLLEPMVGSKHVQVGLGSYYYRELCNSDCWNAAFFGELKWRYGFSGKERRLFDLTNNDQWSRYLLLVNSANLFTTFFASNELALETKVTPKNSVDVYLALQANRKDWHFELGYDYWYRSAEKVALCSCAPTNLSKGNFGIADLLGIALQDPQSASTANISQSVANNGNQMVSDPAFVPLLLSDLNLNSGAAPKSMSNSFYGSVAYSLDYCSHPMQLGFSAAYERGENDNVPDNVFVWGSLDIAF